MTSMYDDGVAAILELRSAMMSAGVLNVELVRRVVRLATRYVLDGEITDEHLAKVFQLSGADLVHQDAVRHGLSQVGITIVSPSGASEPIAAAARTERHRPSTMVPAQRTPPAIQVGVDVDQAAVLARVLIRDDRRRTKPWLRLLTAQEECGLAMLIRGSEYLLDQELPSGFRRGLPDGDERAAAFDAFVLHNLRLVWKIAHASERGDLEVEDVQQAGIVGLHRAVEMFDASRGLKFSTYATNWIKQKIGRTVDDEGRLVRLPVHVWEDIRKIDRARARLIGRQGFATLFELSAETGFSPDRVRELGRLRVGVVSLDLPIGDDGSSTLGDLIGEVEPLADPEAAVVAAGLRAEVVKALGELPDRERTVLHRRMGFAGDPMTLDEIGEQFGVTRERIRQIESKAKTRIEPTLCRLGLGRDNNNVVPSRG